MITRDRRAKPPFTHRSSDRVPGLTATKPKSLLRVSVAVIPQPTNTFHIAYILFCSIIIWLNANHLSLIVRSWNCCLDGGCWAASVVYIRNWGLNWSYDPGWFWGQTHHAALRLDIYQWSPVVIISGNVLTFSSFSFLRMSDWYVAYLLPHTQLSLAVLLAVLLPNFSSAPKSTTTFALD